MYSTEITQQIPSPCFVLDEAKLIENLELILSVKEATGVKILLALKAFAMPESFKLISSYLDGTTASSLNEALLSFEYFNGEAHAYCPAYHPDEIEGILNICNHISFNSLSQWNTYAETAKKRNVSAGIRINPEVSTVKTDLYNPCAPNSRLGIKASELNEKEHLYEFDGFHSHNLCEGNSYNLEETLNSIEEKFGAYLPNLSWLNLGGGHLMTHKDYDIPHLIATLNSFKSKYPNLEIIMEPGSAVVWETGFLKSTVLDIMTKGDKKIAMLDVSFTAHMPDCLEMPYTPQIYGADISEKGDNVYSLGGNTCLAGDFMGSWNFESLLEIGQNLYFHDMMHYTMVKTNMFNGVAHPSIGILSVEGEFQLIRKFGFDDYRNRM